MKSLETLMDVFQLYLDLLLPEVNLKLQQFHLNLQMFITPWILCLFTKNFSQPILQVMWDNLFLYKLSGFVKIILAFLQIFRQEIVNCSTLERLQKIFSDSAAQFTD